MTDFSKHCRLDLGSRLTKAPPGITSPEPRLLGGLDWAICPCNQLLVGLKAS